jgi:hypothetical protein
MLIAIVQTNVRDRDQQADIDRDRLTQSHAIEASMRIEITRAVDHMRRSMLSG